MFTSLPSVAAAIMCSLGLQPETAPIRPQSAAAVQTSQEERLTFLRESAIRINSIDPDIDDFADLQPLKALIGDARVVQLGEQSHGDGAVFLAKCRLIKFLHQEMGFDVLVWESGHFECREVDRVLRDPQRPIRDAWKAGLFGIWALSAQAIPVLEYAREVAATDRPLETAGYDCQITSGDLAPWLAAMRDFYLPLGERHPSEHLLAAIEREKDVLLSSAKTQQQAEGVIQGLRNLGELTDAARDRLIAAHGADEFTFLRRTIDDFVATAGMTLNRLKPVTPDNPFINTRDQRMGENLVWLARERYKGRKLIVWAATMHQVHDVHGIRPPWDPDGYKNEIIAGTIAKPVLGDDLFSIGFDAHTGSAATCFQAPQSIPSSPEGSLGALLAKLEHPFFYVDFRSLPQDHWLRDFTIARPLGYAPMEARWPRHLDGMFFIHTMFPSTQRERAPAGATLTVHP
jgi:erythromycin esterase